jgi:putative N6-adenine-specific DNA methylase
MAGTAGLSRFVEWRIATGKNCQSGRLYPDLGCANFTLSGAEVKNRPVEMFAVVPPGLEDICNQELRALELGPTRVVRGGVELGGGLRELYLANLWLRSASRVLVRVGEFRSRDFPGFFRKCRQLAWGRFIRPGQPLSIRVTSRKSRLFHTARVEEVVREAIATALGRPPVDPDQLAVMLVVQVNADHCLISVDSSGDHLHRRGYRKQPLSAPLRENLAAGVLLQTGWCGAVPLLDPLCGSGTFVIEAALLAAGIPPGLKRDFAFMHWPGFRAGLWNSLRGDAERRIARPKVGIFARDRSADALSAARCNAREAGVEAWIDWQSGDVMQLEAPPLAGLVICNPPYGDRLGEVDELPGWYQDLGRRFHRSYQDWQLALLVPDAGLVALWPARMQPQLRFKNGGISVSLMVGRQEKT